MALSTPSAFPVRVIRITHPRYVHPPQSTRPSPFFSFSTTTVGPNNCSYVTSVSNVQINYDAIVTVISTLRHVPPVTSATGHTVPQL